MDNYKLEFAAHVFQIVCHPTRIKIIQLIEEKGALSVTQIYESINLSQAETSHHLMLLRTYDILHKVRKGRFCRYSFNTPILEKVIKYTEILCKDGYLPDTKKRYDFPKKKMKHMTRDEFKLIYPKAAAYMTELKEKRRKK